MKNCTNCKYANWQKTAAGRLHPSGDGSCKYPWEMPQLPMAFYWISKASPIPYGGHINRKREFQYHCPYYLEDK